MKIFLNIIISFLCLYPINSFAGWIDGADAEDGISFYGSVSGAISDGFGGVLACRWQLEGDITKMYMMRLSADGEYVWGETGVLMPVSGETDYLHFRGLISQGDGGGLRLFKSMVS